MTDRKLYLIQREKERIIEQLGRFPTISYRAITAVARSVLLNAPYSRDGTFFDVKAKSIGAGVWELTRVDK